MDKHSAVTAICFSEDRISLRASCVCGRFWILRSGWRLLIWISPRQTANMIVAPMMYAAAQKATNSKRRSMRNNMAPPAPREKAAKVLRRFKKLWKAHQDRRIPDPMRKPQWIKSRSNASTTEIRTSHLPTYDPEAPIRATLISLAHDKAAERARWSI